MIYHSVEQIMRSGRTFQCLFLIIVWGLGYLAYYYGKKGRVYSIRPLEALEAIYEGIGRAAEMGRPVMVLPGIGGLGGSETLAGLNVLGEVAKRGVEIGVDVYTSSASAQVIAFSEAVVRRAYESAERAESYMPGENVRWFGGDQFSYAVGTAGHILDTKPATVILLGSFLYDVIVSMETGTRVGAQIIGGCIGALGEMAMFADYILIGEEEFAASAMISQDREVISTLAGQDWIKLVCVGLILVGVILVMAGNNAMVNLMGM